MTSPHDQPLSRRDARRAQQEDVSVRVEAYAPPANDKRPRSHATGAAPPSAPTEMTYRTEVRPRVPLYDERAATPVAPNFQPPPPVAPPVPPPVAPSAHPGERIRRRDFRPPPEGAPAAYVLPPGVLPQPPFVEQVTEPPFEHTLSRRELREMRAAEPELGATPHGAAAPLVIEPISIEPSVIEPVHSEPAPIRPPSGEPIPHQHAPVVLTSTGSHWSVGIHDDDDPFENTFSREVGSTASLNTNALVLPEMPAGSIAGPVAGTGEIIVTGMITMSHVVSSTGTFPTVHDRSDFDDLLDADDREIAAPDSAPVSALRAISSHTAAHTVMTGKPSSSNTVTTVLVASTVVMAVVAIGLFVVAVANGLF